MMLKIIIIILMKMIIIVFKRRYRSSSPLPIHRSFTRLLSRSYSAANLLPVPTPTSDICSVARSLVSNPCSICADHLTFAILSVQYKFYNLLLLLRSIFYSFHRSGLYIIYIIIVNASRLNMVARLN